MSFREAILKSLINVQDSSKPEVPLTERLRRYTAPLNGRLRDDGLPFDPTTRVPSEASRGYLTDGIEIVKSMASDLRYARVLNMNQTIIAVGHH